DDVATPAAVKPRFGEAGELRAFHGEIGAAELHREARLPGAVVHGMGQPVAGRMRHRDMGHEAFAEEALLAREGAVDELVDYDEMTGRQVLPQRAAGRQRQDIADAGTLPGYDVVGGVEWG